MSVKREVAENVYATDPRRLSDMVKAGLLEPQSPGGATRAPVGSTFGRRRRRNRTDLVSRRGHPVRWGPSRELGQGDEWGT